MTLPLNHHHLYVLLTLPLLCCISCKISEKTRQRLGIPSQYGHVNAYDEGPYTIQIKRYVEPQILTLEDPSCSESNALPTIGNQTIHMQTNNLNYTTVQIPLNEVSGNFQTEGIDGIYLGRHIQNIYTNCQVVSKSHVTCKDLNRQVVYPGKKIHICRKSGYDKYSAENAALNIATAIYNLRKVFKPVMGKSFSQVRVLITPKIETIIKIDGQEKKFVEVQNAMWTTSPLSEANFNLAFLPHSITTSPSRNIIFTGSPAVALHEYGHHIYFEFLNHFFSEGKLSEIYGDPDDTNLFSYLMNQPSRIVDSTLIVSGVLNEGIADFMASIILIYLKLDEKNIKLSLAANSKERDIDDDKLDNSQSIKELTDQVLRSFMKLKVASSHGYSNPNHQDIHTIGTFIASIMQTLYKQKLRITKPDTSDSIKLAKMLGQWLKNLRRVNLKQRPMDVLSDSIFEGVKVAFIEHNIEGQNSEDLGTITNPGTLTARQCNEIFNRLPRFSTDWINFYECGTTR